MFIHDVTSFYNRPCFFREAKRRGSICILGNDSGKLLPQDANMSKYFCFIDTFASCGAYSFVLEYTHKDKNRRQLALTAAVSKTNGLLGAFLRKVMISSQWRFVNFRWRKDS